MQNKLRLFVVFNEFSHKFKRKTGDKNDNIFIFKKQQQQQQKTFTKLRNKK